MSVLGPDDQIAAIICASLALLAICIAVLVLA